MELSERGLQRKQLNDDFRRMLKERAPEFWAIADPSAPDGVYEPLRQLSRDMCKTYLSYPLLCGRFADVDDGSGAEDGGGDAAGSGGAVGLGEGVANMNLSGADESVDLEKSIGELDLKGDALTAGSGGQNVCKKGCSTDIAHTFSMHDTQRAQKGRCFVCFHVCWESDGRY